MSVARTRIGPGGRLVIPAAQRKELDLQEGDEVVLSVEGDELRLASLARRVVRAQALVRRHNPTGRSLVEGLIQDRRAESLGR